jgi:hypothetical protein
VPGSVEYLHRDRLRALVERVRIELRVERQRAAVLGLRACLGGEADLLVPDLHLDAGNAGAPVAVRPVQHPVRGLDVNVEQVGFGRDLVLEVPQPAGDVDLGLM